MANNKTARKRILINAKKYRFNKAAKTAVRTVYKKSINAVTEGTGNTEENIRVAYSKIDKAVAKGLMHKNTAARRKSLLMKRVAAKA